LKLIDKMLYFGIRNGRRHHDDDSEPIYPFVIPEEPAPAKPLLLIVLPDLIPQWRSEIKSLAPIFDPIIYHGDKRNSSVGSTIASKLDGELTQDHRIFDPTVEDNARTIVVTSLPTLLARHGPKALKAHRLKNGWS
jgi:SNF2 family DNA or RNA helicase